MDYILQSIVSFYESLSTFEVVMIVIVTLFVITVVALYITYRVIKASILKRIRLSMRIATYAAGKVSEKTKDTKIVKQSGKMLRSVVGDDAVDSMTNALTPEDGINVNKDIHELLDELGDDSIWFSIAAFVFKRKFKRLIEEETGGDQTVQGG